jgi:pilus assembly protein FimV
MKTSKSNPDKPVMDGVDDLTRFLDEDFDTEDVDLFEFTSEQDSPLTQLKSIILSLDWEITNETLQDLNDEIDHLKHLEQFESDKVSQVYLQGLDKIGHYIQTEGAYAHPNSIKLLLTLYYDFEKILSSEHITGAEITALLKADVRKFKILQHQIAQKHGTTAAATEEVATPLPLTEHKDLQGIQAAILELDWEVTDTGLKNLGTQLDILKGKYAEDRFIQVIIQGLHSLNSYIIEEKGRAHPEAFSLLDNFYDALEDLVEEPDLDDEKRQEILIDSVNRLNILKNLIAQTYPKEIVAQEAIFPVPEGEGPVTEELGLEPEAAAKAEEKYVPEEVAPAAAVPSEPAFPPLSAPFPAAAAEEDLDEITIFGSEMDEHREIAPALSDSMEERGYVLSPEAEGPPEELAEKLDFFFGEEKEEFTPETIEKAVAQKAEEKRPVEPPTAPAVIEEEIAPALAGSFEEQGFGTEGEGLQAPTQDLADKLDTFFGAEADKPAAEEAAPVTAPAEPEEEEPALTFAAEPEGALAGFEAEPEGALAGFEAEPEGALAGFEAEEITPALADHDEEVGFGARMDHLDTPTDELTEKLDFFFGEDEKKGMAAAAEVEAPVQAPPALEEEPALSFTGEPEEEEVLLTPALAAAPEEEIPTFAEIASPTEYQATLMQMRSEFKAMEAALRQQIEDLRQDVQSLRAQLRS